MPERVQLPRNQRRAIEGPRLGPKRRSTGRFAQLGAKKLSFFLGWLKFRGAALPPTTGHTQSTARNRTLWRISLLAPGRDWHNSPR